MLSIVRLVVGLLRLIVDAVDVLLRSICWMLEHVCLGLEAISEYLRGDYIPDRPAVHITDRIPVAPISGTPAPARLVQRPRVPVDHNEEEIRQMMRALGDKGGKNTAIRAQAIDLLSKAERVPLNP